VSGDYLDIVSSPDGGREITVLLGDIAGKGVAASMLMAHLHASVRTLIAMSLPLSQVVGRANRIFCESTMASHYATLVCARLSADGDVEICNAGHCPPLLVRNGEVQEIESTGVPVGLFCVDDYGTRRLRLEPGDTVLMYTDGVTEARNEDDCEYGAEALSRVASLHGTLAPEALVDRCVTEVTTFRAGVQAVDDLTVLAIRRS
jgi:sigma-B regulation protein RsbU (phosphoserine phosphatase)